MDQGGEGGKYHLDGYKGKAPGLYEVEFGTVRVGKDGKITYHKKGEDVPAVENVAPGAGGDDEDKGDTRISPTGIKQTGMTLGGIKQFNEQYGLNIADGATMFNLTKPGRKGAYKSPDNKIETDETGYTVGKGARPISGSQGGIQAETEVLTGKAGGYEIPAASVPGTTGHTPEDPQNGVSSAADTADQTRAIALNSGRGSRKDPRNRGNGGNTPFGGVEPSNESLVSPMYKDKARNAFRSTFLDSDAKGPAALFREAHAAQGVIRTNDGKIAIKNGDSYLTYTGDKSAREVSRDLAGGQKGLDKHRDQFTAIGPADTPQVQADDEQTPATVQPDWKDMTIDQKKGAVTAYAQDFVNTFKDKLKDKK
jgi:hypothetical protein